MENKIEIKTTTTEEELHGIIFNNPADVTAKAFCEYMTKQTSDWYEQYARANKAEKELAEIKATIFNWAIKQLNQ